ncbi:hypothetical protein C6Y40_19260 [Alteromonas alba]|uniref:Sulfotransferase domain-containing protein n=1 Tax=Alteromonas alba TaxID=2079529 RepID=A0A2S9V659_9ALTE|nr:hypothetical protein [Alteromonas alba]PRO71949.1 hypothetical protein C6Y40_19260 [Alteromonas alba]
MTKLIIHAGLAKTGTTSLQSFLHRNKENLKNSCNLVYSGSFLHDVSAHHKLAMLVKSREATIIEDELLKLKKESDGYKYAVLSSEEICTLNLTQIELLLKTVKRYFDEIEVLFTIRPHFSLFVGSYKQQIREAFIHAGLSDFWLLARKHARFLHFENLHRQWTDIATPLNINIHFMCTETFKEQYNGNIIQNFLAYVNAEQKPSLGSEKKENVSLSSYQVSFLRNMRIHFDFLWHDNIEWDHRRFVYFCYQNISAPFAALGNIEDSEFVAGEILVAENCMNYFENDWSFVASLTENYFPSFDMVENWYASKLMSLNSKLSRCKDLSSEYFSNVTESKQLIEKLFYFYSDNPEIKNLGPSEQVELYRAKE